MPDAPIARTVDQHHGTVADPTEVAAVIAELGCCGQVRSKDPTPDDFDTPEAYAAALAALVGPTDWADYCVGGGEPYGHTETEYAIEPDRGSSARDHDSELAGPIENLADYRTSARLITREVQYGPWRYVTPEEIEGA